VPCPSGRACGFCNVYIVLDRGPLHYVYRPQVPAPSSGDPSGGSRDGSGAQNLRIWTLDAALTAGYYRAQAQWKNVWWNKAASVTQGHFGVAGAPVAEIPNPGPFRDEVPSSLSGYYALIPGLPASRAEPGTHT
jgi:hypothetical protein